MKVLNISLLNCYAESTSFTSWRNNSERNVSVFVTQLNICLIKLNMRLELNILKRALQAGLIIYSSFLLPYGYIELTTKTPLQLALALPILFLLLNWPPVPVKCKVNLLWWGGESGYHSVLTEPFSPFFLNWDSYSISLLSK